MRVFFAITFNQETKEKLVEYRNMIANQSVKGKFTNLNNFHLTLEFIGEVDEKKVRLLINLLYQLQNRPQQLVFSCIGSFKRGNKEIVWLGVEKNDELIKLQGELKELLIKNGFQVDDRNYKPHITIGREVVTADSVHEINVEPIQVPVKSIALMESKRVSGELVYEPLEEIIL